MRVLVTGGAGYIGSNMVLGLLDRGDEPVVLDSLVTGFREAVPDNVPFYLGDVADEALAVIHDGAGWVPDGTAQSPNGAKSETKIIEADHVITAGTTSTTTLQIPQYATVTAVTGRILADITGTLSDWSLGVAADPTRYASGLGLAAGSWVIGMSGSPLTYYADTPLLLTANGGDFAAGTLRLAIHMQVITPPSV